MCSSPVCVAWWPRRVSNPVITCGRHEGAAWCSCGVIVRLVEALMVVQLGVTGVGVQDTAPTPAGFTPHWSCDVPVWGLTRPMRKPLRPRVEDIGAALSVIVHVVVTGIYFSPVSRRMMSPSRYARFPSRLVLVAT